MDIQKVYNNTVIQQKYNELIGMIANLDNSIETTASQSNGKMKRSILPIPEKYGGGFATGKNMEEAIDRLIARVLESVPKQMLTQITFEAYFEEWIAIKEGQAKSPVTIGDYKWAANAFLIPWFGKMDLAEITADDIQRFYNSIIDKSKSLSVQCKAILRGMFERAIRNNLIEKNPMQYQYETSKKQGEKVVLQDEDLFQVVQDLEKLKKPFVKDYLYACFLCFTGMRREEILGLHWDAIDFEKELIHVCNAVKFPNGQNDPVVGPPKADSCGHIRLNTMLAERIRPYQGKPESYIFCHDEEHPTDPITRSIFTKMWYRIKKKVDLKGATSHSFRSTYASMINAHCDHMDIKTLQTLLRHKTPDLAIKVYTKSNETKVRSAEKEYDEYLCRTFQQNSEQPQNGQSA